MSIFKDKKVLVTGAAGLCGTAVVNRLLKMGDCSIIGTTYTRRDLNIENSNLNLVKLYRNKDCYRDYIFIDDVVTAFIKIGLVGDDFFDGTYRSREINNFTNYI